MEVKKVSDFSSLIPYDGFAKRIANSSCFVVAFSEEPLERSFKRGPGCSLFGDRIPDDAPVGSKISVDILDPVEIGECTLAAKKGDCTYMPDGMAEIIDNYNNHDNWITLQFPNGKLIFINNEYVCIHGSSRELLG